MWDMRKLRDRSVKILSAMPLDAMTKIKLGQTYRVVDWLRDGLCDIVVQENALSKVQVMELGMSMSTDLWHLREERFKEVQQYGREHTKMTQWSRRVDAVFREELEDADYERNDGMSDQTVVGWD